MGTRSSLEKFRPASDFATQPMNNNSQALGATLQSSNGVEKALSMNSIDEQCQRTDISYRNSSISSNASSSSTPLQTPRPERPRSAPGNNQSTQNTTQASNNPNTLNGHPGQLPEVRRMAVCEANDDAEKARRRMRVYKKRF